MCGVTKIDSWGFPNTTIHTDQCNHNAVTHNVNKLLLRSTIHAINANSSHKSVMMTYSPRVVTWIEKIDVSLKRNFQFF